MYNFSYKDNIKKYLVYKDVISANLTHVHECTHTVSRMILRNIANFIYPDHHQSIINHYQTPMKIPNTVFVNTIVKKCITLYDPIKWEAAIYWWFRIRKSYTANKNMNKCNGIIHIIYHFYRQQTFTNAITIAYCEKYTGCLSIRFLNTWQHRRTYYP